MSEITLKSKITKDGYTDYALKMYDIPPSEENVVKIKTIDKDSLKDWSILAIIGPSGSGKTTVMSNQFNDFVNIDEDVFNDQSLISNFTHLSPEGAGEALSLCGLASVPDWLKPYSVLSEGQKARAKMAYFLSKYDNVRVDEFTSTVNREVAKSLSYSIQKYVKRKGKKLIVCSCHYDIEEWLNPEYVYDTSKYELKQRGLLRQVSRPNIELRIERTTTKAWELFYSHHYLSSSINKGAKSFVITWNSVPVAFTCFLPQPNERLINTWRGSRTVVLPDFQGLGIGSKISDLIGGALKNEGHDYLSKTTHPSFVGYREKSGNWKLYSKGVRKKEDMGHNARIKIKDELFGRHCYSHRYIGPKYPHSAFLGIKSPIVEQMRFKNEFIEDILNGNKTSTIRNYAKRIGVVLEFIDESNNIFAKAKVTSVKNTTKRTDFLKSIYGDDKLYEHQFELL